MKIEKTECPQNKRNIGHAKKHSETKKSSHNTLLTFVLHCDSTSRSLSNFDAPPNATCPKLRRAPKRPQTRRVSHLVEFAVVTPYPDFDKR